MTEDGCDQVRSLQKVGASRLGCLARLNLFLIHWTRGADNSSFPLHQQAQEALGIFKGVWFLVFVGGTGSENASSVVDFKPYKKGSWPTDDTWQRNPKR